MLVVPLCTLRLIGRCDRWTCFECVIFKKNSVVDILSIFFDIALWWMPQESLVRAVAAHDNTTQCDYPIRHCRPVWESRYPDSCPTQRHGNPYSKVHGANMGPILARQDPSGPHVGPMKFATWECWPLAFLSACSIWMYRTLVSDILSTNIHIVVSNVMII